MRYLVEATIKYRTRFHGPREEMDRIATESILESLGIAGIHHAEVLVKSTSGRKKPKGIKKLSWNKLLKEIDGELSIGVPMLGKKTRARMNSHRFSLFRENNKCVCCGVTGCVVLVEMHDGDESPHLNLYAESGGDLVLMTRDHIHPRCRGGKDHISNYQTMCSVCNSLKGHSSLRLEDLKKLKKIHDKNGKSNSKVLHLVLEDARNKLSSPINCHLDATHGDGALVTMTDLAIYRDDRARLLGRPLVGPKVFKHKYIGNIRRGTAVLPLFCFGQLLECHVGGVSVTLPRSILGQNEIKGGNHGKVGKRTAEGN